MILPLLVLLLQDPSRALIGRWEGTSICIKADWNAACNDETVRYDVVRVGQTDTLMLHAYKRIGGSWDWMGDLPFTYQAANHRWMAPFSNARVNIQVRLWLEGSALKGVMVDIPSERKGRDIAVHRVAVP